MFWKSSIMLKVRSKGPILNINGRSGMKGKKGLTKKKEDGE